MEIFKDATAHTNLTNDIRHVLTCANECVTRLAEKTLDNLVERLNEEIFENLTEEGAVALANLSNAHPESEIEGLLKFLVFKHSAKVESAKEFILRTGTEGIDEDICVQVRVYADDFFIEVHDREGLGLTHALTLENQSWSEPETTLEAMELELFNFATAVNGGT